MSARGTGGEGLGEGLLGRRLEPIIAGGAPREERVRVLTWNCLADGLAQEGDFVRCPPAALEWPARLPLILEEIRGADADVVCMQEVNHFDDLLAALSGDGFSGVFCPKGKSPATRLGFPCDGCALFWRDSSLAVVGEAEKAFYLDVDGKVASQVRLGAWFRHTRSGKELRVVTTHLKAKNDPEACALREAQAKQLCAALAEGEEGLQKPTIVCGDFNTSPDSAAIGLLCEAGFESVWAPGEEKTTGAFTTWKFRTGGQKRDVIDFVFSRGALSPVARWSLPSVDDVGPDALPSARYPSDHLAIVAEFVFSEDQ